MNRSLACAGQILDLSTPQVMGILNITPDSFSDGGIFYRNNRINCDRVLFAAQQMVTDGAMLLDIGGESTRPGAQPISLQEELDRVLPVVEAISHRLDVILSVDTSSPELMLEAARLGAGLINDVRALTRPGAIDAAVTTGLPVCLMHKQGEPHAMQAAPHYGQVVDEVRDWLLQQAQRCLQRGIKPHNILLDPGFGFGKKPEHNLQLLNRLGCLVALGYPILVGLSRKSLIGHVLGRPVDQRLIGSIALATLAVTKGALIVRAHDVTQTVDAINMYTAVTQESL